MNVTGTHGMVPALGSSALLACLRKHVSNRSTPVSEQNSTDSSTDRTLPRKSSSSRRPTILACPQLRQLRHGWLRRVASQSRFGEQAPVHRKYGLRYRHVGSFATNSREFNCVEHLHGFSRVLYTSSGLGFLLFHVLRAVCLCLAVRSARRCHELSPAPKSVPETSCRCRQHRFPRSSPQSR